MTTEREKLIACIMDAISEHGKLCGPEEIADAILAAGFRLVTPSKDVVEAARMVFDNFLSVDSSHHQASFEARVKDRAWDVRQIAAFATAHAARERADEREACRQIAIEYANDETRLHSNPAVQANTANAIAAAIRARTP